LDGPVSRGPVVYWMSRDQRAKDNWALIFAQEIALERKVPIIVVFCLAPSFLGATLRQYGFMLRGLEEVQGSLAKRQIGFVLLTGEPPDVLPGWLLRIGAGVLITDFDPLRVKRHWKEAVAAKAGIPVWEVDGHNCVPCWEASPKQEFGAFTLRPKLHRLLSLYLDAFPRPKTHPYPWTGEYPTTDWRAVHSSLDIDRTVSEAQWIVSGEKEAMNALARFTTEGLQAYQEARNDPCLKGQSDLSPYLHFGQLSAQQVALTVEAARAPRESKDAFLEELIVRRELSDNFCYYNDHYDGFDGFPAWAQKTLDAHRGDRRAYLYPLDRLEDGKTHDELWNAAEREMVRRGKMHGYMRMYWAKKILEWTASPEEAMEVAVYLNDRYELDGRDPNGYAGIAWSIGGVHDRAWGERPVFGKIRFMSYNGARSKFDIKTYVRQVEELG
jgi:deoxyribodipyrimidine photo-lyase